jgi:hypothetical protein
MAMPSPRLETHDEAISQRNPAPNLRGATRSTMLLTRARQYSRDPTVAI